MLAVMNIGDWSVVFIACIIMYVNCFQFHSLSCAESVKV
jgi:hypothetical protein